jgi:hypothetical protein
MKFGIKTKYLESSQGGMDKGNITSRKKTRHTQTFKRKMSRGGIEALWVEKDFRSSLFQDP